VSARDRARHEENTEETGRFDDFSAALPSRPLSEAALLSATLRAAPA